MAELVAIATVRVGERHRKDHGDLQVLADSIAAVGLLQPIGITGDGGLVFGERRLMACRDILGWPEIPARVVDVKSIVEGEYHENEVRKDFTPSERVAIERSINVEIERRAGGRGKKLSQDFGTVSRQHVADESARKAGFGNRETARQARKVVERGSPELVEAMDRGKVSISAAAGIADKPVEEQRVLVELPTRREAVAIARETGNAVLARDGRYHVHVEPERAAQVDLWLQFKDHLWALGAGSFDAEAVVAAVPPYQREAFAKHLTAAQRLLGQIKHSWEASNVAAE